MMLATRSSTNPFLRRVAFAASILVGALSAGSLNSALNVYQFGSFEISQIALVAVFALVTPVLVRYGQFAGLKTRAIALAWVLLLLTMTSIMLSSSLSIGMARLAILVIGLVYTASVIRTIGFGRYIVALVIGLAVVQAFSILLVLLAPSIGKMQSIHLGAWQGVLAQKNSLARVAATCLVATAGLLALGRTLRRPRFALLVAVVLSTATLVGTESATALVAVGAGLVPLLITVPLGPSSRRQARIKLLLAAAFVSIAIVAASTSIPREQAELLEVLGREATLTGRTSLWSVALEGAAERPMFGFGLGGFWQGWEGPSAEVWSRVHWLPQDSHNGFIDIVLDLGLFGLMGVLVLLTSISFSIVHDFQKGERLQASLALSLTLLLVAYNITESTLLRPTNVHWLILCALLCRGIAPDVPRKNLDEPIAIGQKRLEVVS